MNFYVLTLFPEMVNACLGHSIMDRAQKEAWIHVNCVQIRAFAKGKHKQVDDYPYGGGAGMIMQPNPIYEAYQSVALQCEKAPRVVFLTPQGERFTQKKAQELSKVENLVLLCGHYEGVDERVIEEIVTDEISLGDFVLTGGELAAAVVIDAIARLIPGVLGSEVSFEDESFSNGLLEYPHYTRPAQFLNRSVPQVLLSGHHANIEKWRHEQALIRTYHKRADLLNTETISTEDLEFLNRYKNSKE